MFNNIIIHRRGLIGTIIFHLLLVMFFILYKGFTTPLPLPQEEGILINFGTENNGFGNIEPPKIETSIPVVEEEKQSPEKEIPQTSEKEEVLTQDIEEAPEVKAAEKRKKQEEKKKIEELNEQKRLKEIERKKIEEKERKKREQLEQQRKEEKKRLLDEKIKQRFGQSNVNNKSKGEGETKGNGNQGNINGSVNSDNHNSGNSTGNNGISFNLNGRNPLSLPEPEYLSKEQGLIVVEVIVDRDGNVVDAMPGKKGTTITDNKLMEAAKNAAMKAKFDLQSNAPVRQTGTITYHFRLD